MENVFIDHNLLKNPPAAGFCPSGLADPGDRPFQKMPLLVIMVGAMPVLTKKSWLRH